MDREDANERLWTLSIQNFSCWNNGIHGSCIFQNVSLALYPKGSDGEGENLLVRIFDEEMRNDGELYFVSSDGSVLSRVDMKDLEWDDCFSFITTELKFKDIVSNIVKDPSHEDIVSLQYRSSNTCPSDTHFKLETIEKFIEIPMNIFQNLPIEESSCYWKLYLDGSEFALICQSISAKNDCSRMVFKLGTQGCTEKSFVQCCTYCCEKSGDVLKSDYFEHVFTQNGSWIFVVCLPVVERKELHLLLVRLKIATGRKKSFSTYYGSVPKGFRISDSSFKVITEINETRMSSIAPKDYTHVLSEDLMYLYQDHDFSDFELRCGTVSYPTHRAILSARSSVFKAILSGDMKEAACGHMDVEDLDPHTLGRFLFFLYSGTSEDLEWEGALKLYYAADKYQVPSLKEECAEVLRTSVSLKNVCDILSLADKHQDEELTSVARDFILENFNEILGSEEWRSFMRQDPLLLCETLTYFGEKKCLVKK